MADSMRYVQFLGDSQVAVHQAPVPAPGVGEALVQIAVSAICGSELGALRRGMSGEGRHNPGHEMAGVVVEAHGLKHVREGQRVGLQVTYGCGQCIACLQGDPKHCANGMDYLQNGHSEYLIHISWASTQNVTLWNNIIHDSYNNDIIKINDKTMNINISGPVGKMQGWAVVSQLSVCVWGAILLALAQPLAGALVGTSPAASEPAEGNP